MSKIIGPTVLLPGRGSPGGLELGLGVGHAGGASGDRTIAHGVCPGTAQKGNMEPPAQHLQEGLKGLGAMCAGWQPKAGTLALRSPAAETSSRDAEFHLSDGEGA